MEKEEEVGLMELLYAFFNHPHIVSPGYPGQESSVSVSS